jgi:hypothetical protein
MTAFSRPGARKLPMPAIPTVTLLALLAATAVQAADEPKRELLQPPKEEIASPITDHFALSGIYSLGSVSTVARYDRSPLVAGTTVDAEKLLGLDDKLNKGSIAMMFRFADRSRVAIDYFKLTRHGDVVLNQPIVVGTSTYLVSDRVLTDLDLRILGLTYTYSFIRTERFEVGAGLGIRIGQAEGSGEVPARRQLDTFDGVAPLPTLTLDGTWRITKRFSLNSRVQYFAVHTGGVDGSLSSLHADVQYRAWKNLAVGLGYSKLGVVVDSADPGNTGRLDLQVTGPELFLRASF